MPRARFYAPWHDRRRVEALRGAGEGGMGLGEEELTALLDRPAIYHCVSRVVDRRFAFGDREKEKFAVLMRRQEEFSQVRVLAFCVMSNHFHILVEVPVPPPERGRDWTDKRFLKHLSCLYGPKELLGIRWQLELFRKQKSHLAAQEYRDRFLSRMWDLSEFMKELKQAFSRWFNKVHKRRGTLWEERFKSVLAEEGHAARTMSVYNDLNPVRAGIVRDPKDYRWSSFGEAVSGKQQAREGIERVMHSGGTGLTADDSARTCSAQLGPDPEVPPDWRTVVNRYREMLYAPLERPPMHPADAGTELCETEAMTGPVRHFTEGLAVGRAPFLERTFQLARDCFGPRRRDGPRKMRGVRTELRALRDLQRPCQ